MKNKEKTKSGKGRKKKAGDWRKALSGKDRKARQRAHFKEFEKHLKGLSAVLDIPKTPESARTFGTWIRDTIAMVNKIIDCHDSQMALDAIDTILQNPSVPQETHDQLNQTGEELWETMVASGC